MILESGHSPARHGRGLTYLNLTGPNGNPLAGLAFSSRPLNHS